MHHVLLRNHCPVFYSAPGKAIKIDLIEFHVLFYPNQGFASILCVNRAGSDGYAAQF